MSSISIKPDRFGNEAASLELISTDLDIQKGSLTAHESATFSVEPGSYLVRAHWSNGKRTQQIVDVGAWDLTLELETPATEASGLLELGDPLMASKPYVTLPDLEAGASDPLTLNDGGGRESAGQDRGAEVIRAFRSIAEGAIEPDFTVWQKIGDTWKNMGFNTVPRPIDDGLEFDLDVDEGLHVFRAAGGGQTQFVSIPAERSIIALRLHRRQNRLYLRVDARTADPNIEALRGYIVRGEIDVARDLALNATAEQYLMTKRAGPRIAALGAYVLLRTGDLARLHDWPDNLSDWKKWLPDGPILSAWQRLRSPEPDYERAFDYVLEAVRRGMPVYTEGVRLLKDALDLFSSDTERKWDVEAARSRVEAYARAMIWNKSETTYFGSAPDEPHPYLSAEGIPWDIADERKSYR
jgi:hypothetical protein